MYTGKTWIVKRRGGSAAGICRISSGSDNTQIIIEVKPYGSKNILAVGGGRAKLISEISGSGGIFRTKFDCPFVPDCIIFADESGNAVLYCADGGILTADTEAAAASYFAKQIASSSVKTECEDKHLREERQTGEVSSAPDGYADEKTASARDFIECAEEISVPVEVAEKDAIHTSALPSGVIMLPGEDAKSYLESRYERCSPFGEDGVDWFRIETEGAVWGPYYIAGVADNKLFWGVPGSFSLLPPAGLEGHVFRAGTGGTGYWIVSADRQ